MLGKHICPRFPAPRFGQADTFEFAFAFAQPTELSVVVLAIES